MKITKIDQSLEIADNVYSLSASMKGMKKNASNTLNQTLVDLANILGDKVEWALCGGLSVGVYARARGTEDVDIIVRDASVIDSIEQICNTIFKRTRMHAMVHKSTGVEVEILDPAFIKVDPSIISTAIKTSQIVLLGNASVRVVTKNGLIALKLTRASSQDVADIETILQLHPDIDLSEYKLQQKEIELFHNIKNSVENTNTPTDDLPI